MRTNSQTSRRQWIRGVLRGGLLAVFGGASVHLLRREKAVEESDCIDPQGYTVCPACREWSGCKLPRALSVKQYLNKDKNREEQKS